MTNGEAILVALAFAGFVVLVHVVDRAITRYRRRTYVWAKPSVNRRTVTPSSRLDAQRIAHEEMDD